MSDTTQYPDGPYLVTLPNGIAYAINTKSDTAWEGHFYDINGWWQSVTDALGNGYTLTPLVPSTELEAARQRIAELEAEVGRLRAKQWTPVEDGEYPCQCDSACPSLLQIASDADSDSMAVWMRDEEQIGLVHLHGLRLCQRGDA